MNSHIVAGISVDVPTLLEKAKRAREMAYVPYSHFAVGCALVDSDGNVCTGSNVENASYGLSSCAERNTIFSAVHSGCKKIIAICVVGDTADSVSPCGACRQVIREFAHDDILIILSNMHNSIKTLKMEELLPYSFGPEHLGCT